MNIERKLLDLRQRMSVPAAIFGVLFPLRVEPFIFGIASKLSLDYDGGYWHFYRLSNGGFYMAPDSDRPFKVQCENGFDGSMSAQGFGIVCSMYAYSNLSFGGPPRLVESCSQQFHLLREYALEHIEVAAIFAATD